MRRGKYELLDPSKLLPGEWAIVLESDPNGTGGRSLYMCFSPGEVKRIATVEDMATIIANAEPEVSANIIAFATATNEAIKKAEAARVTAENSRVSAEKARVTAESIRASSQTANDNAQKSNNTAQTSNNSAQTANNTAQSKNNTDQAQNNAAAKGMTYSVLSSSQYSADAEGAHNKPTITGKVGVMYLTPRITGSTDEDKYDQWMYINSSWELMGETGAHVDPTTTADIDSIVGGTSVTADRYLNTTGLSYLVNKLDDTYILEFALNSDMTTAKSDISTLQTNVTNLQTSVTDLGKQLPVWYYSTAPTESTVKSEHTTPCLVVVAGGATYLVE